LEDAEKAALRAGTFQLDCPFMELSTKLPLNNVIYSGAGYIKQGVHKELLFQIYTQSNLDVINFVGSYVSLPLGTLIPESSYYVLTVVDFQGRQWTCQRILPKFNNGSALIIHGLIERLTTHSDRIIGSDVIKFLIPGDHIFPRNTTSIQTITISDAVRSTYKELNVAKISSCGCDFEFLKDETQ